MTCPACGHRAQLHAEVGDWCAAPDCGPCDGKPKPRSNLTRAALENIPVTPYADIRPHLRSGDILLCSGDGVFSRLIQWATSSPISHAAILYRIDEIDRVLALEAMEGQGVRLVPLSAMISGNDRRKYGGLLYVLRHRDGISTDQLKVASAFAFDELAVRYGWGKIVALAGRIALGVKRDRERSGWICSELVGAWMRAAGAQLSSASHGRHGYITPSELFHDSSFELFARVL